jgi:hypothetical protein
VDRRSTRSQPSAACRRSGGGGSGGGGGGLAGRAGDEATVDGVCLPLALAFVGCGEEAIVGKQALPPVSGHLNQRARPSGKMMKMSSSTGAGSRPGTRPTRAQRLRETRGLSACEKHAGSAPARNTRAQRLREPALRAPRGRCARRPPPPASSASFGLHHGRDRHASRGETFRVVQRPRLGLPLGRIYCSTFAVCSQIAGPAQ